MAAIGTLLTMGSHAGAGTCASSGQVRECSGGASQSDSTVVIDLNQGQSLTLTDAAGFGLDVSSGKGFYIAGNSGADFVTVDLGGNVSAQDRAIEISQYGMGAVSVTTRGQITSDDQEGIFVYTLSGTAGGVSITSNGGVMANMEGIEVDHEGIGAVSVVTGGTITSTAAEGILVSTASATTGIVEITTNGSITAQEDGIEVDHDGTGVLTITTGSIINSTAEMGVNVSSAGDTILNIGADVSTSASDKVGISITNTSSNSAHAVTLGINNATISSGGSTAIQLTTAAIDVRIIMGDGSAVGGDIGGTGVNGDLIVEFTGTADDNSFDIGNLEGGDALEKTGSGTWTLTGAPGANAPFLGSPVAMINEGRLVWGATSNPAFTSTTVADGATLEIPNTQTWAGSLTLSGVLDITGNDTNLTLDTLTSNGGSVDIDVDFSNGDGNLGTPRLNITTVDGEPITVNIMAMGGFPEISEDDEDEIITIGNLISATTAEDGDFVVGRALNEGFQFDLVYDATNSRWDIIAQATGRTIEDALFETLPAVLSQLASLESYHLRLAGRQHADNMAVWGKIMGASSEFEPNSTSLVTYDIENAEVEFGASFPLGINNPDIDGNFKLGANIAFGDASTDVSTSDVSGKIATDSVAAGISVSWEDERAYFDGQLQYASFGNVFEADEKLADIDATSFSTSAEVGYALELARLNAAFFRSLPDLTLIPSAQLQWSRIDFKDFVTNGIGVELDRGSVITGRVGVAVEKQAQGILMHGRANVIVPLDGEVSVNVADTPLTSERDDPILGVGIGVMYEWSDVCAISADVSTQQGSEVEGYAAKVGFKYSF